MCYRAKCACSANSRTRYASRRRRCVAARGLWLANQPTSMCDPTSTKNLQGVPQGPVWAREHSLVVQIIRRKNAPPGRAQKFLVFLALPNQTIIVLVLFKFVSIC